jgi:hypothetical protein
MILTGMTLISLRVEKIEQRIIKLILMAGGLLVRPLDITEEALLTQLQLI